MGAKVNTNKKNLPKFVRYDRQYVGTEGLPFAVKDAQSLGVPLMVDTLEEAVRVRQELVVLGLTCEVTCEMW